MVLITEDEKYHNLMPWLKVLVPVLAVCLCAVFVVCEDHGVDPTESTDAFGKPKYIILTGVYKMQ